MADLAMLAVLAAYVVFILLDFIKPARKYEAVKGWRWVGLAATLVLIPLSVVLGALVAEALAGWTLLDSSGLGTLGGAAVGFLVSTFLAYWAHRSFHRVDFLWRWVHQMHHSAERVDIFGAFYFHPNELAIGAVLSTVTTALLGLTPEAAGVLGAVTMFNACFQHANVKTPRLLGYLVQRPESHGVHHQRGVHANNYSDFPLWDALFGTFQNPAEHAAPGGFYLGSSYRILDMLLGRDVAVPAQSHQKYIRPPASGVASSAVLNASRTSGASAVSHS